MILELKQEILESPRQYLVSCFGIHSHVLFVHPLGYPELLFVWERPEIQQVELKRGEVKLEVKKLKPMKKYKSALIKARRKKRANETGSS